MYGREMYGGQNVWLAKHTEGKKCGRHNVVAPRNAYLSGQISKIEYCVNLK